VDSVEVAWPVTMECYQKGEMMDTTIIQWGAAIFLVMAGIALLKQASYTFDRKK
jgi:hypothetical protein